MRILIPLKVIRRRDMCRVIHRVIRSKAIPSSRLLLQHLLSTLKRRNNGSEGFWKDVWQLCVAAVFWMNAAVILPSSWTPDFF